MFGPVIEGKLIRLRPQTLEEAPILVRFFEDIEVTRFLSLQTVPTLEFEESWIRERGSDSDTLGWAIEYKGRLVGFTGMDIDWTRQQASTGTVIGDRSAWGLGIASEAMRLRRDYAFQHLSLRKLTSSYIKDNVASGRAQAKAGYRVVGCRRQEYYRDGAWRDLLLTEIHRDQWEAIMAAS
jgi:RimJ/RimL family protein N-acetyltransferase